MSSSFETSKIIIEKIKDQRIKPLPRWIFKARELLLIFIMILSVLFGSLSVSILWINLKYSWVYSQVRIAHGLGVLIAPAIWFFFSLLLLVMAFFHYRKSPRGYRISSIRLSVGLATLSIIIGSILFLSGYSQSIHFFIRRQIPSYSQLYEKANDVACLPNEGMVCGRFILPIKQSFNSKLAVLTSNTGQQWTIDITEAEVRGLPRIEIEQRVRVWGVQTGPESFKANDIRPFPINN